MTDDPPPDESPRDRREREALDRKIAYERGRWERAQNRAQDSHRDSQRPRLGYHEVRTPIQFDLYAEIVPGHGWCPSCSAPLEIVVSEGLAYDFTGRCRCGAKLEVRPAAELKLE